MRNDIIAASLILTAFAGGVARAQSVDTRSALTGWINDFGAQIEPSPDHNMFTGNEFGGRINSYAIFYIPRGNWTSATLTTTPSFYGSAGPNEIRAFDVSTPLDELLNSGHPGMDAFADLGSGNLYGSATMHDSTVSIVLSRAFLNDINAAGGRYFAIGFTNATLNALPAGADQDDGIFINGAGLGLTPITISLGAGGAVPEPASWAMMIGGFGLGGAAMRRRPTRVRYPA